MTAETDTTTTEVSETETPDGKTTSATVTERPNDVAAMERALAKANREAEASRKRLAEIEDRDKSEQQKLTERAEAAEKRAATLELQATRARVGASKGLPPKFWDRLQGDDEKEMSADADDLLAELGGARKTPSFDGGAKERTGPAGDDMNAVIRSRMR